jgi:hypothetical protein
MLRSALQRGALQVKCIQLPVKSSGVYHLNIQLSFDLLVSF